MLYLITTVEYEERFIALFNGFWLLSEARIYMYLHTSTRLV